MGVFRRQWPGVSYGRGEDWHYVGEAGEPAFENSWANVGSGFPALAFRIRESGIIDMQGSLDVGTSGASVIFTLPAGYRPTAVTYIVCRYETGSSSNHAGLIAVQTDGSVYGPSDAFATYVQLSGQFFLTPPDVAP